MLFSSRIKIPWIPQETGCAKRTSQFSVDPASSYQFNFPTSSREHFQISPHFDCQVRSLSGIRWWLRPLTPHDPPSSSSDTDETWIAAKKEILEMENFFFFRSFHIEVIDYFSHSLLLCLSLSHSLASSPPLFLHFAFTHSRAHSLTHSKPPLLFFFLFLREGKNSFLEKWNGKKKMEKNGIKKTMKPRFFSPLAIFLAFWV